MSRILWLNWSGGGNLPPSLGIARCLSERGHKVVFAGRPEMTPRVGAAGFRVIEFRTAYAQVDRYPQGHFMTRAACYLTSPAVQKEITEIVATEAPDLVLIDAMFFAARAQAPLFAIPFAVVVHTFLFRHPDIWRDPFKRFNGMRRQAGFESLGSYEDVCRPSDHVIVTTLAEFDGPVPLDYPNVRHVGPVLENETIAIQRELPWPVTDATPLVLVSFSTGFEQRDVDKLQRTLDALADLPVHVVATTGGALASGALVPTGNSVILDYAAHDPILSRAALVVTHGGHGTAMRALRHGVPMVVIPGRPNDQPFVAAAINEWGAGLALAEDADAIAIRDAARGVLSDSRFKREAMKRMARLATVEGAEGAMAVIDTWLQPIAIQRRCRDRMT